MEKLFESVPEICAEAYREMILLGWIQLIAGLIVAVVGLVFTILFWKKHRKVKQEIETGTRPDCDLPPLSWWMFFVGMIVFWTSAVISIGFGISKLVAPINSIIDKVK